MILDDQGYFFIDLSFYQGDPLRRMYMDFVKLRNYGTEVVIIRAGQQSYADSAFAYNWEHAALAGLSRSSYWFLDEYVRGSVQARTYWNLVKSDPGKMLFLDVERGNIDWQEWYNFLAELQFRSGLPDDRIGFYIGFYHWADFRPYGQSSRLYFQKFDLWLPWYISRPEFVRVPYGWPDERVLAWQKGTPIIGHAVGAHSLEVDYNVFNGGRERLRQRFFEDRNLHDISIKIERG